MSVTKNNIFRLLSSLSLAIFLLSFIAFGSILGTIIKQKADEEVYLSIYSETTYKVIKNLGLDDVFHSYWFVSAIVLFAINLTLCSYGRFLIFIKTSKKTDLPDENALTSMPISFRVEDKNSENTIQAVKKIYKTVYEGKDGLVLQKGMISRYGVYIIHGSILIILSGSLIGLLFGFKGYMVLQKGEIKDYAISRHASTKQISLGFSLKCKDFQVSFYPNGTPRDYVSKVEILENGKAIMDNEIRVNKPLFYRGVNIYQSSYGSSLSFLFNIDGEQVTLGEKEAYEKGGFLMMVMRFAKSIHSFGPGVLVAYTEQGEPRSTWFLRDVQRLRAQKIQGLNIKLEDIQENLFTGLEITKDPGIWVVWVGFALILFGLYANFFVYFRKIYIRYTSYGLIVAGIAFKNKEAFKKEFEKFKIRASENGS